jgi:hypothetical protein
MAKCKVEGEPKYILELSKNEAETLYRLIGYHIVGTGPTYVLSGIWAALHRFDLNDKPLNHIGSPTIELTS